jgi:hypothetical protein
VPVISNAKPGPILARSGTMVLDWLRIVLPLCAEMELQLIEITPALMIDITRLFISERL